MEHGRACDCNDCGGKYILIKDEEDPRLTMFDKPLPCFGCGIGWCSFLLGCIFPFLWYCAATLYLCKYYNRDPRERAGLMASTFAVCHSSLVSRTSIALFCTVVILIVLAVIFL
ncbi:uncharacterized protein LOC109717954 isoform X1 [Ananas comosus]|uniref:Uncharacterized protein LOC109717954 isoform X1 n=1 Tax=Ananas comosus TaxID=4615 RepID=A0A6P5G1G7_ANACO|nr:uncharacterized protein LOC109717954 isoform X1 [Ananas comosus]